MNSVFKNYHSYIEKVDLFCLDVHNACGSAIVCRKGCAGCCRHLSLFPVEAVHMRMALEECPEDVRQMIVERASACLHDPQGPCPLLDQGECLLYQVRPMICRTHGYPILVEDDQGLRVDHCPLNFSAGETIERQFILDLNTLNTALATLNQLFVNEHLAGQAVPERLLLSEALLMNISAD